MSLKEGPRVLVEEILVVVLLTWYLKRVSRERESERENETEVKELTKNYYFMVNRSIFL